MSTRTTYADAKIKVERLVDRFARNLDVYKHAEYKETQVRVEFIDPFFEALGWDVRNARGYAEQYKDVVHEDAIKIGGATRAPDYCFRVGGVRKFFLEDKKPSVSVRGDVGPAYQLRRYAWSAKLPLSILTAAPKWRRSRRSRRRAASTTRTYIVDYIVKQTVGKLIEGKTPRQISKLRVLDPACGSGSFLLGAYQYLLDYHRRWYEAHDPARYAKGKRPAVYQAPCPSLPSQGGAGGGWRLTTAEKKRILLNNIYGVDIDRQAVEVTKLSLLLKVLEGESQETLGRQLALWRERALPDLGDNIKCGNSLIGPDYFEAQLMPDEEEMRRVNPLACLV